MDNFSVVTKRDLEIMKVVGVKTKRLLKCRTGKKVKGKVVPGLPLSTAP
jgi:hypothetical protein